MNKDKLEVLNAIAANNGHKDWLGLIIYEGPITILNCTIEAMELYAQPAQLQQHTVMQAEVSECGSAAELPREGVGAQGSGSIPAAQLRAGQLNTMYDGLFSAAF